MLKIPKILKVGDRNYKVRISNKPNEGVWGTAVHSQEKIILYRNFTGKTKVTKNIINETFMHELLHCVDAVYNNQALSEKAVGRLSHGLHQVFKDNKIT